MKSRCDVGCWRIQELVTRLLARYSVALLQVSLGLVFLRLGPLPVVPGVSPAEGIAERSMDAPSVARLAQVIGTTQG